MSEVLAGNEGIIHNTDEIIAFLNNFTNESPLLLKEIINTISNKIQESKRQEELFFGFRLE